MRMSVGRRIVFGHILSGRIRLGCRDVSVADGLELAEVDPALMLCEDVAGCVGVVGAGGLAGDLPLVAVPESAVGVVSVGGEAEELGDGFALGVEWGGVGGGRSGADVAVEAVQHWVAAVGAVAGVGGWVFHRVTAGSTIWARKRVCVYVYTLGGVSRAPGGSDIFFLSLVRACLTIWLNELF